MNITLTNSNFWLLLEKSDETRVSNSFDGYDDTTGEIYNYDSLVPNHLNLRENDTVLIRKENSIIGYGIIGNISKKDGTKPSRRCPECEKTDIRERKTKTPKWRCGKCSHVFTTPIETISNVILYSASIEAFVKIPNPPDVESVKRCSVTSGGTRSQISMMRLDKNKIKSLLSDVDFPKNNNISKKQNEQRSNRGQGFGLTQPQKKAVELCAMKKTTEIYENQGWKILDKSATKPYDLLAIKGNKKKFIEVKGTTGEGESVILTHGEVKHANNHSNQSALVVIGRIELKKEKDVWVGLNGEIISIKDPWLIDEKDLKATQFRYSI